jgi:hypothetical protein
MIERIVGLMAADGKSGTARRMKPNVPSFSMMLASTDRAGRRRFHVGVRAARYGTGTSAPSRRTP